MRGAGNTYRGPGLPVIPAPGGTASIALPDAAAAAEALAAAVAITLADAGAGADQAAAAALAPLADAAAAAEAGAAVAATAVADAAAAADQQSAGVAAQLAESGGGADSGASAATVLTADTAGAAEAMASGQPVALAEAAGAADAVTVPAETLALADAAAGAETSPQQAVGSYVSNMYGFTGNFTAQRALFAVLTGTAPQVTRYYKAPGDFTYDANMQLIVASGVKMCLTLRPAYNPVSAADLAAMTVLLQALSGAGATAEIALWHEPYFTGLTSTQHNTMIQYYGPTVRLYFPLVFCGAGNDLILANGFYTGDSWFDKISSDTYALSTAHPNPGANIVNSAAIADAATPPKPLGLWEFNGSTDEVNGQSQSFVTTWWGDVQAYFAARIAAGKPNADVLLFNAYAGNFLGNATNQACGFEGGISPWFARSNCTVAASAAQAYEGTGSLAMTATGTANMTATPWSSAQYASGLPCAAGNSVTAAAWFRAATAARTVSMAVGWYDSSGTLLSTAFGTPVSGETAAGWFQCSQQFTAPASAAYAIPVTVVYTPGGAGEVHYADNSDIHVNQSAPSLNTTIWSAKDYRIPLYDAMLTALAVPRAAPRLPAAVSAPLAEAAGAAESLAVSVTVPLAEQAGAAEAQPRMLAEPAGAAESALIAVSLALADAAGAADAPAVAAVTAAADAGGGADQAAVPSATVPLADTAAGGELAAVAGAVPLAEPGAGSDAPGPAAVSAGLAEAGGAADAESVSAGVPVALADAAAAADPATVAGAVPVPEAAAAAERLTASASAAAGDQAGAADAITAVSGQAVTLADAGGSADAVTGAAALPLPDAAGAADALSVGGAAVVALTDAAGAADAQGVTAVPAPADAGAAADALATIIAAAPVAGDSAGGTEALSAAVHTTGSDTAAAGDILVTGALVAVAYADRAASADSVTFTIPALVPQPAWDAGPGVPAWTIAPAPPAWQVDAGQPRWQAEPSPPRWAADTAAPGWVIIVAQFEPIAAVSQENVPVTWTSSLGGAVTDPTAAPAFPVRFAFPVSSGDELHPAGPSAWFPGVWVTPGGGYRGFIAQCPVGPTALGGLVQLAAGQVYDVWSEIDTGTETKRAFAGQLGVY